MKYLLIFISLFLSTGMLSAQNGGVTGRVVSSQTKLPLEGASVALYRITDSMLVKVEVCTADGTFELSAIEPGKYFFEASSVGYAPYNSAKFELIASQIKSFGDIALNQSEEALSEVVVVVQRPLIERKIDKLIFNVESSISASGSSVYDMLEKAPGVIVDHDGNISLKGKSGVIIYIDDRPTYMSSTELANYLKSIPAASLDRFEIMANPSAKYDAAGNSGIINIKTKKIKNYGFNGSLNTSVHYDNKPGETVNLNLNYRNGNVNLFGNYSQSAEKYSRYQDIIRKFKRGNSGVFNYSFDQITEQPGRSGANNLKVGTDYYIGTKTIAGVVVSGFSNTSKDVAESESWFGSTSGVRDSGLAAISNSEVRFKNFATNFNLRHQFDSTGKSMTINLDFISYDKPQITDVKTRYLLPDGSQMKPDQIINGETPSKVKIYSGKLDFTLPAGSFGQIETGLKGSYVKTDNDSRYDITVLNVTKPDYGKTNHFIYDETILAGYVSWSKQIKKWGIQVGLRAENTRASGRQLGNPVVHDSSFTKNYLNLFPTAFVSYTANENNSFGLNIGRRIQRANYGDLNPFVVFIDEYTYNAGNVYLQPQFTNMAELSYNYKALFQASVGYSHTNKMMTEVLLQDTASRIVYQTKDNLAKGSSLDLGVSLSLPTGKILRTNVDVQGSYTKFEGQISPDYFIHTGRWGMVTRLTEQASFEKGWAAELMAIYVSTHNYGQGTSKGWWRADATVQKNILKEKGNLSLRIKDIFDTQSGIFIIRDNVMNLESNYRWPNPMFTLSFKYNFGKPIKGLKRYNPGGASEEQRRVGG
ncbi:MAG: TonB-dependent receptor [Chitinophagaceae bacterium]|nr:TonB-dependent receptor [Chitinophagaceae bacterium]